MKRTSSKIIYGIMACCILVGGFSACRESKEPDPDSSSSSEEEIVFELNYHIYDLSLYDTLQLDVEGFDNVSWISDNSEVVTVDENGVVEAIAYGTANITATSGEYVDTCIVTVRDEGYVPTLTTAVDSESFSLFVGDTFALKPCVLFNDVSYDDLTVEYEVSDETKAEVNENGVVTAKSVGSTTISLRAEWRGFDALYLNQTITLTVVPDISIEMTANTQEIYTVEETIDGKEYGNKATLSWDILLNKQSVTDGANVTFEISDESVLTVTANGEITGLKRGYAEVVLIYTLESEQYRSLPLEITVCAPEKQWAEEPLCYDVNTFENLTLTNLEGEFLSVAVGNVGYTESAEYENGTLIVSDENIKAFRGEKIFKVETTVYTYTVPTVFATHLIGTLDEYKTFNSSYTGGKGETNKSESWYVVLTADINCDGATLSKSNGDHFAGTFNGLGHNISNVCVSGNNASLFGALNGSTVIENLGLINIVGKSANCYLLAGYFYGSGATVRNIYLKGEYTVATSTGFVRQGNTSKISNCIIDITYADGSDGVAIATEGSSDYISNTYAIGNASNFATSKKTVDEQEIVVPDSRKVYATAREFVEENREKINEENGWNEYWSQDGTTIYFNGLSIMPLKTARTLATEYKKDSFTVNVADYLSENVKNVYINDKPVVVKDGKVTINPSEYIVGTQNRLSIFGETDNVTIPFVAVTHTIASASEFTAFIKSYEGSDNGTENWYVVLTDNIAFNSTEHTDYANWTEMNIHRNNRFKGTFNGLGHTISGVKVGGGQKALFGGFAGATIKNVGFVDIVACRSDATLLGYVWGAGVTIDNVYVKGYYKVRPTDFTQFYTGAFIGTDGEARISNCIVDVTYSETVTDGQIVSTKNNAVVKNTYAIGDSTKSTFGTISTSSRTDTTVYADGAALINANASNIKAENGWNEYWTIQNGDLYFGNTKVE